MNSSSHLVFTDGSSRGNPGPGGWGAVIVMDGKVTELGGGDPQTTNNRMELTAAAAALEHIPAGAEVRLHTDSSYVINGITSWVAGWKRNGWLTKTKAEVLNKDLWMRLSAAAEARRISWVHVGGHVGIAGNERCDEIATACADGRDAKLYTGPLSAYAIPAIADISHDPERAARKKSSSSHSARPAYSYVSRVDGVTMVHKTWAECEKRVKGARGARFKKAFDKAGQEQLVREFSQGL